MVIALLYCSMLISSSSKWIFTPTLFICQGLKILQRKVILQLLKFSGLVAFKHRLSRLFIHTKIHQEATLLQKEFTNTTHLLRGMPGRHIRRNSSTECTNPKVLLTLLAKCINSCMKTSITFLLRPRY